MINKIQLTPKETKINKKGTEVDTTLYLVRVDANNLALMRGDRVEDYFGDVRTALKRAIELCHQGIVNRHDT